MCVGGVKGWVVVGGGYLPGGYLPGGLLSESVVACLFAPGASLGWGEWWVLFGEECLVPGEPSEVLVTIPAPDDDVLVLFLFLLTLVVLTLQLAGAAVLGVLESPLVIPFLFANGELPFVAAVVVLADELNDGAGVEILWAEDHIG